MVKRKLTEKKNKPPKKPSPKSAKQKKNISSAYCTDKIKITNLLQLT